jgi:hypothetical protein
MRSTVRGIVSILVASALLAVAATPAVGASAVRTCGYIRASVPYSAHGQADRWRVYLEGAASCASAVTVLDTVMHTHGKQHQGGSEADSYTTFNGWLCPFGLMGEQTCELPARLPDHPPIHAHALALDCTAPGRGCPARVPSSAL